MLRSFVFGLAVLVSLTPFFSLQSQGISSVDSSPESLVLDFIDDGEPALLALSTFSVEPTSITFGKDAQEFSLLLVLTQFNETGAIWDGLNFEITGGTFATPPFIFGGDSGTFLSDEFSRAQLITRVESFTAIDLAIDFDAEAKAVLTLTPIIPEPASIFLLGVTALALTRSRVAD